jgi:hypothetical protein
MTDEPKKPIPRAMSRAAYARHRGCDPREIRRALAAGLIHLEGDGRSIDPVRADREWAAGVNPASAKKPGMKRGETTLSRSVSTTFTEARTRSELAKAAMATIRVREREGELVNRPRAVEVISALARAERDAWQSWPARVSALLAAELKVEPHALEVVLERAVRDHLATLADIDVEAALARLTTRGTPS